MKRAILSILIGVVVGLVMAWILAMTGCATATQEPFNGPDGPDTDLDGLSDARERMLGTSVYEADTDHDGFIDLAEVLAGSDPNDPGSGIPPQDFYVVLPYRGSTEYRDLMFTTHVEHADVFLLVDTTGSMTGSIRNIQDGLRSVILPGLLATIPDVEIGVGYHDDFPVSYYGEAMPGRYPPHDVAFGLLTPMTRNIGVVEDAIGQLHTGDGGDNPESQVEALYQVISGTGLGAFVAPSVCVEPGQFGAACFRPGSVPIVLEVTDAPFHNGVYPMYDYEVGAITPTPHRNTDVVSVATRHGVKIIGMAAGTAAIPDLSYVAEATGTTGTSIDLWSGRTVQRPLVFSTPGGLGISESIVDAIVRLSSNPMDVTILGQNDDEVNHGVNALQFITSMAPLSAVPPDGVASMTDDTFVQATPGTELTFQLQFRNTFMPPGQVAQVFEARILLLGDHQYTLDSRRVFVVVEHDEIMVGTPQ